MLGARHDDDRGPSGLQLLARVLDLARPSAFALHLAPRPAHDGSDARADDDGRWEDKAG